MTQDTENTEGVGWTFDCALRGLGEIVSSSLSRGFLGVDLEFSFRITRRRL